MFVCAQHFVWRSIIKFAAPTLRLWHVHFIASGQFSPASAAHFFGPTVGSDGSGGRRTLTALPSPRRSVRSLEETLLEMANMDMSPLPKLIAEVLPYR